MICNMHGSGGAVAVLFGVCVAWKFEVLFVDVHAAAVLHFRV